MFRVKTPLFLQLEAVECGAACLGMILEYYGKIVPLSELRVQCGVSRDGVDALSIVEAAKKYGMKAKGLAVETLDATFNRKFPFIAYWSFNHFVVVEGVHQKRKVVYLNDPAHGHRQVSLDEFDKNFPGILLAMEPDDGFVKGGAKPSMIRAIAERFRHAVPTVIYLSLAAVLLAIPALLIPMFSQVYLDRILGQARTDWLRPLLVAMVLAVLFKSLMEWLKYLVLRRLSFYLSVTMSSKFIWHVLRLPMRFYTQRYSGEIAMRQSLNDSVAETLSGKLADTCLNVILMVFLAALMFYYSIALTFVGIAIAVVNFIALQAMSHRRKDANMRARQDFGKASGATVAALQSMETIKASGQESAFFAVWASRYARAINTLQELQKATQSLAVLPVAFQSVATALIYLLGGHAVIDGHMSIGSLVAFIMLMYSFQAPIAGLVDLGGRIQELDGNLKRLDDVLEAPLDPLAPGVISEGLRENDEDEMPLTGQISLQKVTFGYRPLAPPLFKNFDLEIEAGKQIAFVGGSGSGKSTLAALLCGLYLPWDGKILFDGKERPEIPHTAFAHSFSMVSQDVFIFEGSVRDNLTLWDSTIADETLVRAIEDAAISDAVFALPGGLDGLLLEGGANLSGGQRQRLEIARALVGNPTILLLDEATSALDAETEAVIIERLRLRGCTCILVAHRLSTIRDSDEIIVLRDGRITEQGTHDELWASQGMYAELLQAGEGAEKMKPTVVH